MNKSRLPHEVCEQILDSCRVDADERVTQGLRELRKNAITVVQRVGNPTLQMQFNMQWLLILTSLDGI